MPDPTDENAAKNPAAASDGDAVVAAGKKLLEIKKDQEAKKSAANVLTDSLRPNSVELAVNAKGGVQPTVKVYHDDPKEAAKIALETLGFVREQLGDKVAK